MLFTVWRESVEYHLHILEVTHHPQLLVVVAAAQKKDKDQERRLMEKKEILYTVQKNLDFGKIRSVAGGLNLKAHLVHTRCQMINKHQPANRTGIYFNISIVQVNHNRK